MCKSYLSFPILDVNQLGVGSENLFDFVYHEEDFGFFFAPNMS